MTNLDAFGAQSMTAPLRDVLVKRPGPAFGRAFDDPAHGFLHPVDLAVAQREHDAFVELLAGLGPTVHELGVESDSPDLVYQFDPLLVTDRGAIPLRAGKPNRRGEELVVEAWVNGQGIPTLGRIEPPGTIEGGDTFWLRPDLLCIGPDAAHERGRRPAAGRAGRRRRPDLRRPVLARSGRADPSPVGDLAGRRRPGRGLPAAPAGRPAGSSWASSGSG